MGLFTALRRALRQNIEAEKQHEEFIRSDKRISDEDRKEALRQLEAMKEYADKEAEKAAKEGKLK